MNRHQLITPFARARARANARTPTDAPVIQPIRARTAVYERLKHPGDDRGVRHGIFRVLHRVNQWRYTRARDA